MLDLTMSQVLTDPLIRQMLRADGVKLSEFAILLEKAASERGRRFSNQSAMSDAGSGSAEVRAS
ncbi:hypothetical protein K9B32_15885 [Rhizobium sp. 3T7]|uniref:hypothetical protein n=1 Tax=Rhizobium sp. 3T7 TaxID=2874922 RepID=UPI001CCF5FD7|nr:hypothetical protein [Rhizobium sp. 3T7]MBZ9791588.1 hypothetical protein [Rhizobium sp. 3T7]